MSWTLTLSQLAAAITFTPMNRICRHLSKDFAANEPIPLLKILTICTIDEALELLNLIPDHKKEKEQLAAAYAELVLPICESICPESKEPRRMFEARKKYACGQITYEELSALARETADRCFGEGETPSFYAALATVAIDAASAAHAAIDAVSTAMREEQRRLFIKMVAGEL